VHDLSPQRPFARRSGQISTEGELEKWKLRDPIKIYRERLRQFGVSDATIEKIDASVRKEVDDATEVCKAAPNPPLDIITTDVYADGGWAWRTDLSRRRHSRIAQEMARDPDVVFLARTWRKRARVQGDRGPL